MDPMPAAADRDDVTKCEVGLYLAVGGHIRFQSFAKNPDLDG